VKYLSGKGIRVNQTLVLGDPGASLGEGGRRLYRPFLGRLDDIAHVGMDLVRDICEIYRVQASRPVLAASIRNPLHVVDAARPAPTSRDAVRGARAAHEAPADDIGLKKFLDDWRSSREDLTDCPDRRSRPVFPGSAVEAPLAEPMRVASTSSSC